MSCDTIYRKRGRRYEPVGIEWRGWPADGWWLCRDGSQSLIEPLDSPNPLPRIRVKQYRESVLERVTQRFAQSRRQASLNDIVTWTLDELADVLTDQGAR